ncbi:hypothetical protein M408DRAFT_330102 [Serendipita vermifera MAFF 305830]|uniref:Uncharacterized protein n=1 Tax=Serendipita vermifera MAFF 305830 TaxID=933852 RepID=A0A0C3AS72_SERVB|nr:hypothetical protein M408DRAFT_330102 [Serendipita vermifera MAFF 305830]
MKNSGASKPILPTLDAPIVHPLSTERSMLPNEHVRSMEGIEDDGAVPTRETSAWGGSRR